MRLQAPQPFQISPYFAGTRRVKSHNDAELTAITPEVRMSAAGTSRADKRTFTVTAKEKLSENDAWMIQGKLGFPIGEYGFDNASVKSTYLRGKKAYETTWTCSARSHRECVDDATKETKVTPFLQHGRDRRIGFSVTAPVRLTSNDIKTIQRRLGYTGEPLSSESGFSCKMTEPGKFEVSWSCTPECDPTYLPKLAKQTQVTTSGEGDQALETFTLETSHPVNAMEGEAIQKLLGYNQHKEEGDYLTPEVKGGPYPNSTFTCTKASDDKYVSTWKTAKIPASLLIQDVVDKASWQKIDDNTVQLKTIFPVKSLTRDLVKVQNMKGLHISLFGITKSPVYTDLENGKVQAVWECRAVSSGGITTDDMRLRPKEINHAELRSGYQETSRMSSGILFDIITPYPITSDDAYKLQEISSYHPLGYGGPNGFNTKKTGDGKFRTTWSCSSSCD